MLRDVESVTVTSKVGMLLHALQNSSDASCSSNVDAYQPLVSPSQA